MCDINALLAAVDAWDAPAWRLSPQAPMLTACMLTELFVVSGHLLAALLTAACLAAHCVCAPTWTWQHWRMDQS